MTQDESTQIEELLLVWHEWQAGYFPALGGNRCDPTCREYRTSNQFLTPAEKSEMADRKIATAKAESVDVCVDSLKDWRHRSAIQIHMKNRKTASVWSNPRLEGKDHEFYQAAKLLLLPMFLDRGLVKVIEAPKGGTLAFV